MEEISTKKKIQMFTNTLNMSGFVQQRPNGSRERFNCFQTHSLLNHFVPNESFPLYRKKTRK